MLRDKNTYVALTEQLLKSLPQLKVIIQRDYMNYFLAYIAAQVQTHTSTAVHKHL